MSKSGVAPPHVRVERDDAFLSRTDLAELGLPRRAVDAVFGALPIVQLPGYSRPFVRVEDYRRYIAEHTHTTDKVRPCFRHGADALR